jgi:hypothetical protein
VSQPAAIHRFEENPPRPRRIGTHTLATVARKMTSVMTSNDSSALITKKLARTICGVAAEQGFGGGRMRL